MLAMTPVSSLLTPQTNLRLILHKSFFNVNTRQPLGFLLVGCKWHSAAVIQSAERPRGTFSQTCINALSDGGRPTLITQIPARRCKVSTLQSACLVVL